MSKIINVTCAIILKDEKILVAQRNEKMKLPLKWEFPGGKLEFNESETECIKREIKEEININIEVLQKLSNNS
jgi:8-oxo-dGTP diphosphatase